MTTASDRLTLTAEVAELLEANGYTAMPTAITIGDVQLEVPGLWQGPSDTLDLTIVAGRPSSREEKSRLHWVVQRLTRALDGSESRRTITLILVGGMQFGRTEADLLELARVLIVDGSLSTERMIGPVLRLKLPAGADGHRDGIEIVAEKLSRNPDSRQLVALLQAAPFGTRAVTERYCSWVEEAFQTNRGSNV